MRKFLNIMHEAVVAIGPRPRGRPQSENPKQLLTLRLDSDVIDAWRQSGPGYQTRINDLLRQNMPR